MQAATATTMPLPRTDPTRLELKFQGQESITKAPLASERRRGKGKRDPPAADGKNLIGRLSR